MLRPSTPGEAKRARAAKDRMMKAMQDELRRGDISAVEVLAVLANTTGACIAYQDQNAITPAQAMELVGRNIEAGNREALTALLSASGRPN